jgi:hypothetical protein
MRNLLPMLFLPLLLASGGCGKKVSDTLTDSGPTQDDDDERTDGGCEEDIPTAACADPCGGGSTGVAQCIDGTWQCPPEDGIDCPWDGGPDACSSGAGVACSGDTYCTGVYQVPSCENGVWSCEWAGECEGDGGEPDAPEPVDASRTLFACGDQACDPTTTFCAIVTGGPVNEDGGASSNYYCELLPPSCVQGQPATCQCVQGVQGSGGSAGSSCIAENGDVIVTYDNP